MGLISPSDTFTFEEIMDDLASRFITNNPAEELRTPERVGYHIERAHWFYLDKYREQRPELKGFRHKQFSRKILYKQCPILQPWAQNADKAYKRYVEYRDATPVFGAIILNPALSKCLLVKGASSRKPCWGFPKGKRNENEAPVNCAIREVLEETGYDISPLIRIEDHIQKKNPPMCLYIITGVPEDTKFVAQSNKEITKHAWNLLSDFKPGTDEYYTANSETYRMVKPFMKDLKNFLNQRKNGQSYSNLLV